MAIKKSNFELAFELDEEETGATEKGDQVDDNSTAKQWTRPQKPKKLDVRNRVSEQWEPERSSVLPLRPLEVAPVPLFENSLVMLRDGMRIDAKNVLLRQRLSSMRKMLRAIGPRTGYNIAYIAFFFDTTERTIRNWIDDTGMSDEWFSTDR